jgi:hypothetical protein
MLWIWLACSSPSPEQVALDPKVALETALDGCRTLDTPLRQGRCALDALSVRNAISIDACAKVPGERWANECLFQVAERSAAPLADRYAICQRTGDYARECGFHLWQKDLMDLAPGRSGQMGVLIHAEQLLRKHRPFAEPLDYSFEQTFWTWFWGAWWEQQPAHDASDHGACLLWSDARERVRCQTWADRAHQWLAEREKGQPK